MVGGRVATFLHYGDGRRRFTVRLRRHPTRYHVRLIDALLVIAPFGIPNVLVLERLDDPGLAFAVVPQLAIRLHDRLDPIDHADDPHCRPDLGQFPIVVERTEELERAVAGAQRLPVDIVKLQIVDLRVLRAALVAAFCQLVVFRPVAQRQTRYPLSDLLDQLLLGLGWSLVQQRFQLERTYRRLQTILERSQGGQQGAVTAGIGEIAQRRPLQEISRQAQAARRAPVRTSIAASAIDLHQIADAVLGRGPTILTQALVLQVTELYRRDHQQSPGEDEDEGALRAS